MYADDPVVSKYNCNYIYVLVADLTVILFIITGNQSKSFFIVFTKLICYNTILF